MNKLTRLTCFLIVLSLLFFITSPSELECSKGKFSFTHPMTVINLGESEIVQERIAQKIEPQYSAFNQLLAEADLVQGFVANPPKTIKIMGGYEADSNLKEVRRYLWNNAHAAYTGALAYHYTREPRYADQAIAVLNAWADRGVYFTGKDAGLQLGSYFTPMLYAVDLLHDYPGWSATQRKAFESWWRKKCLIHTAEVMRARDNNWKDAGMLGVLAAGVAFEDERLLNSGHNSFKKYFKGNWKIKQDHHGTYLPHEVVRNGGSSGITYTAYALTTMVQSLEILRYAGYDYWDQPTTKGATLQGAIECFFRWNTLNETFPWHQAPGKSGNRFNTYEIANNHFDLPQLREWLSLNRPVKGEQGDEWVTLNKGDLYQSPR